MSSVLLAAYFATLRAPPPAFGPVTVTQGTNPFTNITQHGFSSAPLIVFGSASPSQVGGQGLIGITRTEQPGIKGSVAQHSFTVHLSGLLDFDFFSSATVGSMTFVTTPLEHLQVSTENRTFWTWALASTDLPEFDGTGNVVVTFA